MAWAAATTKGKFWSGVSREIAGRRTRVITALICLKASVCVGGQRAMPDLESDGNDDGFSFILERRSRQSTSACRRSPLYVELERHRRLGGGKGWQTGPRRVMNYSAASIHPGDGCLAASTDRPPNPAPSSTTSSTTGHCRSPGRQGFIGTVFSDGEDATTCYSTERVNQPSIIGRRRSTSTGVSWAIEASGRDDHDRQSLRRVGIARHEPGTAQLPDHGDRGIPEQRQLRHHCG